MADRSETAGHDEAQHHHGGGDYAAAIYGSIVATSIIGALREAHVSAQDLTLTVAATVVVFFLAHTWAAITGARIHHGHMLERHRVWAIAREEWPMVEAGFVPVFILTLGWVGVLDADDASRIALIAGVIQLFAWGFVLGRRMYHRFLGALLAGLANGLLGLVLVLLEIAVSH